jgi:predicted transcriptional regulator
MLDFFSTRREFDYSETDIAKHAGVSMRTTFREIPKFEQLGLVKFTRRVGRAKMYKLDPDSEVSKSLQRLVYDISTKRNENSVQDSSLDQKKIVKHEDEIKVMESNIA